VKDFFTRLAERAVGTAPRVDPQVTSRYAPARLPLPESSLPETPSLVVNSPRVSRPPQVALENEPAEKLIAPSLGAAREESERIKAPDRPRKFEQPPLQREQATFMKDRDSGSEIVPDTAAVVSVSPLRPQSSESRLEPIFSSDDAPSVEHKVATVETLTRRIEIRDPVERSAPLPEENLTAPVAKPEVRPRPSQSVAQRVTEKIVERVEHVESSANPPQEFVANETGPTKVSEPRQLQPTARFEQQPIARGEFTRAVVRPTEPRDYERPERSERKIQVKIGRIEVNAPPAPSPVVVPPPPPTPKLSLAEFLLQHNRSHE
jgi:hypothetical protein